MTDMPAIDAERAVAELTALATNLGVETAAFEAILEEVMGRALVSPDWGRPHEVLAEIRRRLLEIATSTAP